MAEPAQVGLVGCGAIGHRHARALAGQVGLCWHSRSRTSSEHLHARFGGRVCETFADLLAMERVEAVVIATPPQCHCEQILQALEAGKSILVEKPLCVSPEELGAIGRGVEACPGPFLMVAENYCYKPSLARIRRLIEQGCIGPVRSVRVAKCTRPQAEGWRRQHGALLEGGIHFAALVDEIFGVAPVRVTAEFPGRRPDQSERHSRTRLEYPDGAVAELHYAWDVPSLPGGLFQHSRIRGERGSIGFESNGLYLWLRRGARLRPYVTGWGDLMGYGAMTEDFLACLRDRRRRPHSDLARARRALEIVFRAYGLL
jgi:predicted dehydrogenase